MSAILSSLVGSKIGKQHDEHIDRDDLYKSLYGRRYMIVLDDIWSTKFWDDIRRYFPDNNNGSRIVITTRESDVAKYADSKSQQHWVELLSKFESWNLLRRIVFGEEKCPYFLQGIGGKIASDCGGLPLAINVIGGILSKVERSREVWENIAKDVRVAIAESDEQCSNILSFSYNHLSNHLRPCFLYMGAFPEDYEIKGSKLVRMWIGEGFVKSNGDKSLEEEAEDYLKALVERNLLLVTEFKYNGKPNRFSMHDLLRDLCISIANEDKFLELKQYARKAVTISSNPRRVCFHAPYSSHHVNVSTKKMAHVRSFLSIDLQIQFHVFLAFRLLRVLDVLLKLEFSDLPTEVLQLVNLRYLAISCNSSLPKGISRLCNLQTLIANTLWGVMPCEIWDMSELRHIKLLARVRFEEEVMKKHVLKKLQTFSCMRMYESPIWKDVFLRFPNIKKLTIVHDDKSGGAVDLSHLHKLEKFNCSFENRGVVSTIRFPSSLKSLTLKKGFICSRDLSTLCDLPNLETLIISNCKFEDEEWELGEDDEFRSLRYLHLGRCNMVHCRADETNFPTLRHLSIAYCYDLEEIPGGIGEIPTLQLIELKDSNGAVIASAKQILEVQQSDYGNYDLQLRINGIMV